MMIPAVVLVLSLAASGFSLPVTPQGHVSTENVPQYFTEVPLTQVVEKTGVEGSPEIYSSVGQQQQVQSNIPVTKTESAPASANQPQVSYYEHPALLPVQPLSVVGQAGQVFRPVIVPAEAITAGRVIIAGIETIQQRSFPQDEIVNVENPVPFQQVHPATYTPVQVQGAQPYYTQLDEKQTAFVPTGQKYNPGQVQYNTATLIKEQTVPVPGNVEQVQNYNPVPVEPNPQYNQQVYNLPTNVQPIVVKSTETYQVDAGYVPVQTVQQPVQQIIENQVYTPVQSHEVEPQTYTSTHTVTEYVEKQGEHQQQTYEPLQNQPTYNVQSVVEKQGEHQQQTYEPAYNVQSVVEKQGEHQQQTYEPVQSQPTYNVQSVVEKQGEHQQQTYEPVQNQQTYNAQSVIEKQGEYQTYTAGVQQQEVQTIQQGIESQVTVQRVEPVEPVHQQHVHGANPVNHIQPVQAHPVEPFGQQVYSAQPSVDQVQSQVPYQEVVQQQGADYVPQTKTSEVEHQQPYVQTQQVVTEPGYTFGDKIHQHTPVHVLSTVSQSQVSSVQPSVE